MIIYIYIESSPWALQDIVEISSDEEGGGDGDGASPIFRVGKTVLPLDLATIMKAIKDLCIGEYFGLHECHRFFNTYMVMVLKLYSIYHLSIEAISIWDHFGHDALICICHSYIHLVP